MFEEIPEALKQRPHWVCCMAGSKAPMRVNEYAGASTADPKSWGTFAEAAQAVADGVYDHIGYVFADDGIVGIDIDDGWDEEGLISPLAWDIINTCCSYTELSRSGRGFHILMLGDLPFKGRNNQQGVEIYKAGRYFITTGLNCLYSQLEQRQDAIDSVVAKYFPQPTDKPRNASRNILNPTWRFTPGRVPVKPDFPTLTPGSRNMALLSWAGVLRQSGMTKKQMYDRLMAVNREYCEPQLTGDEIRQIVNSSMRYKR